MAVKLEYNKLRLVSCVSFSILIFSLLFFSLICIHPVYSYDFFINFNSVLKKKKKKKKKERVKHAY